MPGKPDLLTPIGELPEWKVRWLVHDVVASTLRDVLNHVADDMSNDVLKVSPVGGPTYLRGVADSIDRLLKTEQRMREV